MKYFTSSYIVTVIGLILAWFWGEHVLQGSGFSCVFIAAILSILEVSLSFDNAVINATKLEKMTPEWRHRFITWGILIAVFGMRLIFPIAVVAIFAQISCLKVLNMALNDVNMYAHYLHQTHAPIVSFGGTFLMMLFMCFFFNNKKEIHWLKWIEKHLHCCSNIKGIEGAITLILLVLTSSHVNPAQQEEVLIAGIWGIVIYLLIDGISHALEKHEEERAKMLSDTVKGTGLISFLYLELIDASFSLDGVLGAFALSKDILIITIGLSIGAIFVRSLTIMLVEKKSLAKYLYLEHGAHWAIGALAAIMLISTFYEVSEYVTGSIGLAFILAAFISSVIHNKKTTTGKLMDLKYPQVTFVVTSYNYSDYILKTLESIKQQSYKNIEIIVVDDCSTDDSVNVIQNFIKNNPTLKIKLIKHDKNYGQLKAIQTGLKNSISEFICFIDSDDILTENYAQELINTHLKVNTAFISSQISYINETDEIISVGEYKQEEIKLLNSINAPFGGWFWQPLPSAMFRKSSIEPVLNYKNPEDWKICPDKFLFNFANLIGGSAILNKNLILKRRHLLNAGISDKISGNKRFSNDKITKLNIENNKKIRFLTINFIKENKNLFNEQYGKFNTQSFIIKIYFSYFYAIIQILTYVKKLLTP